MNSPSDDDIKTLAWKPRLKDPKARSRASASDGSMRAADLALANMGAIEKRRARGVEIDEAYVVTLASRCRPAQDTVTQRDDSSDGRKSRDSRRMCVGAAVVACGLVIALLLNGALGTSSLHTVAGRVLFERRPAGDVEIRLHPAGDGGAESRVVTAQDGTFEIDGLPTGQYQVTLHPSGESSPAVPAAYMEPGSALFTLNVNRDVSNVQLCAYRKPPAPRKASWTPGVD